MASFMPSGTRRTGTGVDWAEVDNLCRVVEGQGALVADGSGDLPMAAGPHDPNCDHCGAPPDPRHPVACRFCGTECG
jgi:hypothetical protein